jgi:hypothetical protein
MHENREISGASRLDKGRDRSEKAESHNADMHVPEKSDRVVVPMNQPNKGEQSSAEVGEGRARTKENIGRSSTSPTQSGKARVPGIERCAASRQVRFAALSEVRAVCVNALLRICAGGAISNGRSYRDTMLSASHVSGVSASGGCQRPFSSRSEIWPLGATEEVSQTWMPGVRGRLVVL